MKKSHKQFSEACVDNDLKTVRRMIDEGIDLTEVWTYEYYPLAFAVHINNLELAKLLVEAGMPLYENSKDGVKESKILTNLNLLGGWCNDSHETIMYLLECGSNINSPQIGFNGVSRLALLRNTEISEKSDQFFNALMEKGIDVDMLMENGELLLHSIVAGKNSKYIPPLIRLSKQVNAGTTAYEGRTPLFEAVRVGNEAAVNTLIEMGADVNKNVFEDTILDDAYYLKESDKHMNRNGLVDRIIETLIKHGAKTYQQMVDEGLVKPECFE
ncbi:ankyrin repeat domain-containing protein [Psychromonas aquimarina]|uniref:ankyrin repeat domain-containing protein n=1 Tax=Psychromonas aquimarina TaxID=444919 RepID=UPI00040F2089|nr:ankyrin repeat domain-containing protein [Psychromonas aquimarina]